MRRFGMRRGVVTETINYLNKRREIKTGDLLAWTHRTSPFKSWHDFKVWVVRLAQLSEYSHVGIAYWEDERLYVIEAVTPRPRKVLLSESLPCWHTEMDLHWTNTATAKVWDFTHNPRYQYSAMEAVKAFFGLNSKANSRTECAELVTTIFEMCGVYLGCRDTPSEVMLAAQKSGGSTVLLSSQEYS